MSAKVRIRVRSTTTCATTLLSLRSEGVANIKAIPNPTGIRAVGEGDVEVGWASLPRDQNSTIVNEGGDVVVRLPSRGGCRFDAVSESGWVESDHPDVRVGEDGRSGRGTINRRSRPVVTVRAHGPVYVRAPGSDPGE